MVLLFNNIQDYMTRTSFPVDSAAVAVLPSVLGVVCLLACRPSGPNDKCCSGTNNIFRVAIRDLVRVWDKLVSFRLNSCRSCHKP